jgi:lactoylglutathione lyase
MKGFVALAHVAIKVKDLGKALDFYIGKLGFGEMMRLHKPDGSVWLVYLRVTDDQYVEVFPGAMEDRAPGWDANGVNHFCFTVDDLDAALAELDQAGIPLLRPKKMGPDNNYQAWIEDPDGNRIELMQIMPDAMQLAAIRRLKSGAAASGAAN